MCHTARKQGTQSRAVPAHNSSGEICPLQSLIPQDSSEAPLQPPGRSAVTHRLLSRPGGTAPSQGEPPLPKSIANQTQRGTRGGAMPKIHTAASSAEGRERYTCWRTRALRNGALRPLCVPLPSPPGSPLARGGRTCGEIASLLFQVAFSSSASYQLPRAPGGQTSACRG